MVHSAIFQRVLSSFSRGGHMKSIGARLIRAEAGVVEIEVPFSEQLTQQHGSFHGGVIATLADVSGGFASLTLTPHDQEVTTVEFKLNIVNNFKDGTLRGIGKVIKNGKRIIVTTADVYHIADDGKQTICAIMQQTLVPVKKPY